YTFCHFLSQKLGVSFARQNDIIYPNPKEGSSLTFSIYHAMTPLEEQELLVFVNKCRYSVLAEEYSEMEFLLRINGSDDAFFISRTVEAIREISGVMWVGELDSRVLRHPGRVFWEMPSVISPPHSLKRVKFIR
ncbi:MAG: IPExxxVDY family protein, partial [Flavobacteriia bacterium]|nr:IPExxxVDY family protein [Flavobacteriia bacterium]